MKLLTIAVLLFVAGIAGAAEKTPGAQAWKDAADMTIPSFYTGNKLFQGAQADRNGFLSYVAGVHDSLKGDRTFCGPEGMTLGQAGDVVMKYLTKNPENRDQQAHLLLRYAFTEAWPCPTAK